MNQAFMTGKEKSICDLVRESLRSFPLYEESHWVFAVHHEGGISIGYKTTNNNMHDGSTNFDIQIIGDICYILWIELAEDEKGRGFGRGLYSTIENFARSYGCSMVRLFPSGWTRTGKTRLEYMMSLGYRKLESGEVEKILR